MACSVGWCGRGDKPRSFKCQEPIKLAKDLVSSVSRSHCDDARYQAILSSKESCVTLPPRTSQLFSLPAFGLLRITLLQRAQVVSMNIWNKNNPSEYFDTEVTKYLQSCHLKPYDHMWSCRPYVRQLATLVNDSLKTYSIDQDGAACHDLLGLCDNLTYKVVTGRDCQLSCESCLMELLKEHKTIGPDKIHNACNFFICSGLDKVTHEYFTKESPAEKGDYVEILAHHDLIVALTTCPRGDCSVPVKEEVPDSRCGSIQVETFIS